MKISILSVQIDQITLPETIERLKSFVKNRRPQQIVTVNPEFVMAARTDEAFRTVLNQADLAVADGAGLLWASRVLRSENQGEFLTKRLTGTDLIPILAQLAVRQGWSLYLLGGERGVAQEAAKSLEKQFPGLVIAGAEDGPMINTEGKSVDALQEQILQASFTQIFTKKPEIVLVAFGAPKQDRFIARYKSRLGAPIMIGVGGAFDFLAGRAHRAPRLLQMLWLEWLWRLITEPWRMRRIWTAVVRFPLAVLVEKWTRARILTSDQ